MPRSSPIWRVTPTACHRRPTGGWGERAADAGQAPRVVGGDEAVVEGLKADPCLGCLTLGEVVAVQADPGGVREVGPELEEEGPEVIVVPVKVEVVHDRRGGHDPGVALARLGVDSLLGAEDVALLLGSADEEDPLGAVVGGQVPVGHVVLALALGEVDQVEAPVLDEAVDAEHEVFADRVHERRGDEGHPPVALEEPDDPRRVHELGLVEVQVHPVDALDLQGYVVGEDVGDAGG